MTANNNLNSIREFLTDENYKKIASFYRDVKRVGKIQKLYWFLDTEINPYWGGEQSKAVAYLKQEILLNFSYYREKRIREEYRKWHPRAKRK